MGVPTLVATIAESASLSDAIYLGGGRLLGLVLPAGWDTADVTFQGSPNGVDYYNLYESDGTELTFTGTAEVLTLSSDLAIMLGIPYIKLRSGTSGTAVDQTAAREIILVVGSV